MTTEGARPIRVGVSACLLGRKVRFDGGHKRSSFVADTLAEFVELVPVCPEVEAGMPIPRPAVRLEQTETGLRLAESKSGRDWTEEMERYAAARVEALAGERLSGFVLKKDSPSCGMERVKVYRESGMPARDGVGLFARELMRANPSLPVEEEGRLNDAPLRECFVERVFAFDRLRALFEGPWTSRDVIAFHTAQKLQLMAHSPTAYRSLGRLVAGHADMPRETFVERYVREFMAALSVPASKGRQTNALHHAAGYLKRRLDAPSRSELASLIDDYRSGVVPISVPIALLRHHVRVHQVPWLVDQVFLDPHPKELGLRNHV